MKHRQTMLLLGLLLLATLVPKPSPAHAQIPPDRYVLYVTLSDLFVDTSNTIPPLFPFFGSIDAADYYVNDFADQAGLFNWDGSTNNIFQVVMSYSFGSAINRLNLEPGIPVVNTAGAEIIASAPDLFAGGPLTAAILTEFATTPAAGTKAWTGTSAIGSDTGGNCGDWSSTGSLGTVGDVHATDGSWLQDINQSCSNPGRLYGIGAMSDADFDLDGDVDDADLTQWQGDYGVNADSDANGDGESGGLDFLAWQTRLGYSGVVPLVATASVPEPSSLLLVLLGIVSIAGYRPRSPTPRPSLLTPHPSPLTPRPSPRAPHSPTPDLRPPTSDLSPLTSDLSPPTSHLRPLTSDLSPLTSHL